MQQYDTLAWAIKTTAESVRGLDQLLQEISYPTLHVSVAPVVNGAVVTTPWVFSTLSLLARDAPGYYLLDMFTCECGVAGCANIHDDVHVRVNAQTVQWQFPREEPFTTRFIPTHFANNQSPMVWTFEANAYHAALQSLREQLQELERANPGVAVTFWSDDGEIQQKPLASVDTMIQEYKAWLIQKTDRINDDKAYWGPLYQADLLIPVENTAYTISVYSFLEVVCDQVLGMHDDDDPEIDDLRANWMSEQVGYYRANPQELIPLFKSMPWAALQDHGYIPHPKQTELCAWIGTQWPNVPASVMPYTSPEETDWTVL